MLPMTEPLAELSTLRTQLAADLMLCTTRDQHIRLTQRIILLDSAIAKLSLSETV